MDLDARLRTMLAANAKTAGLPEGRLAELFNIISTA
jgi:hypothetical protein